MSTVIGILVGIVIGYCWSNTVSGFLKLEQKRQIKAIMERFDCDRNSFTYFYESDDFYLVSYTDKEYRIKFSLNTPLKIVYCQEVMIVD